MDLFALRTAHVATPPDLSGQALSDLADFPFYVTFPNPYDQPAIFGELTCDRTITFSVTAQLWNPIFGVALEISALDSLVKPTTVPEVAVDKNNDPR
jgi:hypothetical protein